MSIQLIKEWNWVIMLIHKRYVKPSIPVFQFISCLAHDLRASASISAMNDSKGSPPVASISRTPSKNSCVSKVCCAHASNSGETGMGAGISVRVGISGGMVLYLVGFYWIITTSWHDSQAAGGSGFRRTARRKSNATNLSF